MDISVSILSIKDDIKNNIDKLDQLNINYIHLDIMDGIFVPNKTWNIEDIKPLISNINKPLDVHLMVDDINTYIDSFSTINPSFITFHYEASDNIIDTINYIKSKGIKVGMAIKPNTKVDEIYQYLPLLDLILVMSVEPGMGGQQFMLPSIDKLNKLKQYRIDNNLNYKIEVDGGINNDTINLVRNADIIVVGSYITNNNYQESINILRSRM